MSEEKEHAEETPSATPAEPAVPDGAAAEGAGRVALSFAEYEELKALARERDDYLRRLQRAVADYQNLQKRIDRFNAAAREAAVRSLAEDILPVADTLALALGAAEAAGAAESILEGLRLVEKEFYGALARSGIRPVEAVGKKFDPHYHEAAMQEAVADVPPNMVVRELKKGFVLDDLVLRPSQVVVSGAPPQGEGAADPANGAA